MDFDVKISSKAYKEYYNAYEWYEKKLAGLGDRFEDSLARQIGFISRNPLIYASKKLDTREAKIEDFPYLVVYKIIRAEKVILITSIFHTSRSPRKKYKR